MKQKRFNRIQYEHSLWLQDDINGTRANLCKKNLSKINLNNINLSKSDLSYSKLENSELYDIDFKDVILVGSSFINTTFINCKFKGVNFTNCDLTNTTFINCNLSFCIGNNKEIKTLQLGDCIVTYYRNIFYINHSTYTLDEIKSYSDIDFIQQSDGIMIEWWRLNKKIIIELMERELK